MNIIVPFSKEIEFKNKIAEVVSISLEEDISINDNELLGDFIVSGEYKNIDINVDTFPFEHVLPFSVNLDKDIDIETIKYEIVDFSYDVISDNILKVNIKLSVDADKKIISDELFIKPEEELREEVVIDDDEKEETIDEVDEERVNDESTDLIKKANLKQDYITYHVHTIKETENIDTICEMYNISKEELLELNDITTVISGDKIIIPDIDEK